MRINIDHRSRSSLQFLNNFSESSEIDERSRKKIVLVSMAQQQQKWYSYFNVAVADDGCDVSAVPLLVSFFLHSHAARLRVLSVSVHCANGWPRGLRTTHRSERRRKR